MAAFFSVVIPVFNRAGLIAEAIQSVVAQTYRDYELIVVDDGSSDGSGKAARAAAPEVRLVTQQHAGPGPARNLGLQHAGGIYVVFLDSDDLWFPWTLASYREAIERHPSAPCFFGAAVHFTDVKELQDVQEERLHTQAFQDYLATLNGNVFQGTGVAALRTDWMKEGGGFHAQRMFCEDLDFLMRMGTSGPVVHVQSPAMVALRVHAAGSRSESRRTYDGTRFLIRQEKLGKYPGGRDRSLDRRALLLKHILGVLETCITRGDTLLALRLYTQILPWLLQRGESDFAKETARRLARDLCRKPLNAFRGS